MSTDKGAPPPIALVYGKEKTLSERAVSGWLRQVRDFAPDADENRADAEQYQKGELSTLVSGSLFSDAQVLVISGVEKASDAFIEDFAKYVEDPLPGVWVILKHTGGNRGARVLRAIRAKGYPETKCEELTGAKGHQRKLELVAAEVKDAGGIIDRPALFALVAAVGEHLGELLAVARQLVGDSEGHITEQTVHSFFQGRSETTPFEAADALVEGDGTLAILKTRQALLTGVPPVVLVSVLARKFRELAKVRAPGVTAADLGMAPWLADKARKSGRAWTDEALALAIRRLADADAGVKGASRDASGAVELAVAQIYRTYRESLR